MEKVPEIQNYGTISGKIVFQQQLNRPSPKFVRQLTWPKRRFKTS